MIGVSARRAVVTFVLLGLPWAAAQGKGLSTTSKSEIDLATLQAALLEESNRARVDAGLNPLTADPGLARSAQAHAEENAERGILDHGSPDPEHDTLRERIALAGVALTSIGENLALSTVQDEREVAADVVARWLDSPAHRANLLDAEFSHVGFGADAGTGGIYITQHFGVRVASRTVLAARPETRLEARWRLTVQAPSGLDAALFAGSSALAQFVVDGPTTVEVPAIDGAVELSLGVATDDGTYRVSDQVRVEPDGSWRSALDPPPGPATFVTAELERTERVGLEIEIGYDEPLLPFVLLVDGEHRPEVVPHDGRLRTWVPPSDRSREIAVGLLQQDGRIMVLERFTLGPGLDAPLVPGTPPDVASGP